MYTYSKPVPGLSAIQSAKLVELVHDYEKALVEDGYNPHVVRFQLHSVAHFVVWFEREELETIDEGAVAAFERHRTRCRCSGTSRSHCRSVVSCVRVFLRHLRKQGKVPAAETPAEASILVAEFLQWMRAHRGAVQATLTSYRLYVTNLIEFLGDEPQTYT